MKVALIWFSIYTERTMPLSLSFKSLSVISQPSLPGTPSTLSLSTMSGGRRKLRLNTVAVDIGCSSCRRPRLSKIFHPKPNSKRPTYHKVDPRYADDYTTTTTTTATASASSTFSPNTGTPQCYSDPEESDIRSLRAVQGFGRVGGGSVAVEKDSDDPYLDFRRSMLQMILEREIYSREDLRELLNCFLQLNSPCFHGVIVRAFTEIWNGVISVKSPNLHLHGGRVSRAF
ncbi:transcription repressor OFP6-like [Diospyros lotus]|uniref:transcription repressor OFP6-like n=1 Tax=Diospyros lotus TaxID=55363 RepID=UPI00225A6534|nr:transcription repressor OFP6-like [Diospyros lotus]